MHIHMYHFGGHFSIPQFQVLAEYVYEKVSN